MFALGRRQTSNPGQARESTDITNIVMISVRTDDVEDRAIPGHRERDLRVRDGDTSVMTLVERSTRSELLLHQPNDHGAQAVKAATTRTITPQPSEFTRSVTWDQGGEVTHKAVFTIATSIPLYFCEPHPPWQREHQWSISTTNSNERRTLEVLCRRHHEESAKP